MTGQKREQDNKTFHDHPDLELRHGLKILEVPLQEVPLVGSTGQAHQAHRVLWGIRCCCHRDNDSL